MTGRLDEVIVLRFDLADGSTMVGPMHGSGGVVHGGARMRSEVLFWVEALAECALEGDSLSVYEPQPGHVCVYDTYHAHGSTRVSVPLAGTRASLATDEEVAQFRSRSAERWASEDA